MRKVNIQHVDEKLKKKNPFIVLTSHTTMSNMMLEVAVNLSPTDQENSVGFRRN